MRTWQITDRTIAAAKAATEARGPHIGPARDQFVAALAEEVAKAAQPTQGTGLPAVGEKFSPRKCGEEGQVWNEPKECVERDHEGFWDDLGAYYYLRHEGITWRRVQQAEPAQQRNNPLPSGPDRYGVGDALKQAEPAQPKKEQRPCGCDGSGLVDDVGGMKRMCSCIPRPTFDDYEPTQPSDPAKDNCTKCGHAGHEGGCNMLCEACKASSEPAEFHSGEWTCSACHAENPLCNCCPNCGAPRRGDLPLPSSEPAGEVTMRARAKRFFAVDDIDDESEGEHVTSLASIARDALAFAESEVARATAADRATIAVMSKSAADGVRLFASCAELLGMGAEAAGASVDDVITKFRQQHEEDAARVRELEQANETWKACALDSDRRTRAQYQECADARDKAEQERDAAQGRVRELEKSLDELANVVGEALLVQTLDVGEELAHPSEHAIVQAMLTTRKERDAARAELETVKAKLDLRTGLLRRWASYDIPGFSPLSGDTRDELATDHEQPQ